MLNLKRALGGTVAAAALVACSSSETSPATATAVTTTTTANQRPACVPTNARLLKARGDIAYYRVGDQQWVCGPQRREMILPGTRTPLLQIAGSYIAYVQLTAEALSDGVDIVRLNLAAGPGDPGETRGAGTRQDSAKVGALRLLADGTAAWTRCSTIETLPDPGPGRECRRAGTTVEVVTAKIGARNDTVLDRGKGIRLDSLRLKGRTLVWSKAGRRKSAGL